MNIVDVIIAGCLTLFAVRGWMRGLLEEVAVIVGVLGGFYLANNHSQAVLPYVRPYFSDPGWSRIAAYAVVFLAVIVLVSVLAAVLRKVLQLIFLGILDRIGGAAAGLAKGALICAIMLTILVEFLPNRDFVRTSAAVEYSKVYLDKLKTYIPRIG